MYYWAQSFADALRKGLVRERLLQNSHRSSAHAVLFDGVVCVSGHEENADARKLKDELTGELRTCHTRHDDISEEQVQSPFVFGGNAQSVRAAGGCQNAVACAEQNFRGHPPHGRFILDQKYGFAAGAEVEHFLNDASISRLRNTRQERLEHASGADFAFRPDKSATLLHDSIDGRKAEPCSLPFFFRGEKGLENALTCLQVHANSCIPHQ